MGDETLPLLTSSPLFSPLTDAELAVLRRQYEQEGDNVSVQTKFNYAWGLVKSSGRRDQSLGVKLLAELFRDAPSRRRECLYYLAVGHYRLGNYSEAKRYNQVLLGREPTNPQAIDLEELIERKVNREGLVGVAIISGVVAVSGVLLGTLLSRSHRR